MTPSWQGAIYQKTQPKMMDIQPAPPRFKNLEPLDQPTNPEARDLVTFWRGLRQKGVGLPAFSALKPTPLLPFIHSIYLLEVLDGGQDFNILSVGEQLRQEAHIFGVLSRASALKNLDLMDRWKPVYRWICETNYQKPLYFQGDITRSLGVTGRFESVILPFGESGAITHLMAFSIKL